MSVITDSSSISDFCSFSISRGGKSDFQKINLQMQKFLHNASPQIILKKLFKKQKNGEILEIEINGLFKGKIDKQTNIKLKILKIIIN